MQKSAARMLIAGTGSGCGKTTVTCAILQALVNRGHRVASFKCGPDYIDPMFHTEIIGAQSANIDLFFAGEALARSLFLQHAAELNVIEGVMGYYDGTTLASDDASSYRVAQALSAPAVLVVGGYGMALSVAAVVKGFLQLRGVNRISGVIFNRIHASIYPALKDTIERECGVHAYGYLPENAAFSLESRHLGLVTAQEVDGLHQKMEQLAMQAEKTIDLDGLLSLMRAQEPLCAQELSVRPLGSARIALAQDRAFCFYYRDNLELLTALGATLVPFSPLCDRELPPCDGLLLGGGYPELTAQMLSENTSMRESVRTAIADGLPTLAECGGFMYLCQRIGSFPMVGVFPGECCDTRGLSRFGYATLTAQAPCMLLDAGESIRGHEFHYWDADCTGDALIAVQPSGRQWTCAYCTDTLYAGYPHLYLPSNPRAAQRFLQKCLARKVARAENLR